MQKIISENMRIVHFFTIFYGLNGEQFFPALQHRCQRWAQACHPGEWDVSRNGEV
ncbi:hypothetical protein WH367_22370 [Comamonas sp. MYb21]|uniref:hypothetical protein n=1 Tax=unclassified Comamonas TaxID=2638500 RepID=UPI0030A2B1EE